MRIVYLLAASVAALGLSGCGAAKAADPLTGTTWRLLGIDSMAPNEQPNTIIDDPAKYTVMFGDDGQAAFQLDCNRGSATWTMQGAAADSGSLTFGPIGMTKMLCPQPSADTKVAAALGEVRSYLISDGRLHLAMQADSGIMNWEPQKP